MILFFKGKSLDKGGWIAQIENITDGDIIYASEALGKPFIFKRFKEPNNTWFWCNNGCSADGIIFVPTQNVRVWGFTWYAANQKDSYEMKYRVKIDNNSVEEDQISASGWEDKYYFRFRLKGIYDANAGSKIEFTVWIAENLQSQTEVRTYHGDWGDDYETYENEHMGLFKVESSSESDNGTGV